MYDLPSENPEEPGLPDEYHDLQPQLLSRTFRCPCYPSQQVFAGTDLNLYYDVRHTQWYKRPDWFLVVGISRLYEEKDLRSSYVVWQEGVNPFVVVELLSPGTAKEDLGENAALEAEEDGEMGRWGDGENVEAKETPPRKWDVYERILRVPYYVVFSRYTNRVHFFKLVGGHYQEQALDPENPRVWIPELEVGLGLWQGDYEGIDRQWLRWYDDRGNWIATDTEQERQEKEQALLRAEQAESQLQQVVLNLLQQGMTVEQVARLTGFPEEQVQRLSEESGE
jgi:Uma2 family endonuclease